MTNQEAIKEIQIQISTLESMIAYNKDFEPKSDNTSLEERMAAAKIAISAIKRLIPNKPTGISQVKGEPLKVGKCPNCGAIMGEDTLWCDDCGQAIDWNEQESSLFGEE